jgi:hypothetical protein
MQLLYFIHYTPAAAFMPLIFSLILPANTKKSRKDIQFG